MKTASKLKLSQQKAMPLGIVPVKSQTSAVLAKNMVEGFMRFQSSQKQRLYSATPGSRKQALHSKAISVSEFIR